MSVIIFIYLFSIEWRSRTLAWQQELDRTGEKINSCVTSQTSPVWIKTCPLCQEPDNLSAEKGMNFNTGKNISQLTQENWKYRLFHVGYCVPSWGNKVIPPFFPAQAGEEASWMNDATCPLAAVLEDQCFGNGWEQLIPFVGLWLGCSGYTEEAEGNFCNVSKPKLMI